MGPRHSNWLRSFGHLLLVLTDVLMPGMDGLTLARKLQPQLKRGKIALMSGHLSDSSWWPAAAPASAPSSPSRSSFRNSTPSMRPGWNTVRLAEPARHGNESSAHGATPATGAPARPQRTGGRCASGKKNACPQRTYLAITLKQWRILELFREPKMVPQLETIIEQRLCPPLGELYELVLKAVRARILVLPDHVPANVSAVNWAVQVRPTKLRYVVWGLLGVGLGLTAALHPQLPRSFLDTLVSLAVCAVALGLGTVLAASLLRGGGGEVYALCRWGLNLDDVRMLPPRDQTVVLLAPIAVTAAITGFMTWNRPEWSFYSLIALMFLLRPILHGRVGRIIRVNAHHRLSDAEHAFIFPLNRTPRWRWRLLRFSLRQPATWKEIGYGAVWTLAISYFILAWSRRCRHGRSLSGKRADPG